MNRHEEQLDYYLNQLNTGQGADIPVETDPELASLFATTQHLRRAAPRLLLSTASGPARAHATAKSVLRTRFSVSADMIAPVVLAIILLMLIGGMMLMVRGSSSNRETPDDGAVAVGADTPTMLPVASPTPTAPAAPAWTAELQYAADTGISGYVVLLPSRIGEYELTAVVWRDQASALPLTWTLKQSTCAAQAGSVGSDEDIVLSSSTPASDLFTLTLQEAWMTKPLVLVADSQHDRTRQACVDLPVAAARSLQPSADSQVLTTRIQPLPGWTVSAQAQGWTTPNGAVLLRVEVSGPASESDLIWHIVEGTCQAWSEASAQQRTAGRVFYRDTPLTGGADHYTFSMVIAREWLAYPLAVSAFVNGGGPMVACGEIPNVEVKP